LPAAETTPDCVLPSYLEGPGRSLGEDRADAWMLPIRPFGLGSRGRGHSQQRSPAPTCTTPSCWSRRSSGRDPRPDPEAVIQNLCLDKDMTTQPGVRRAACGVRGRWLRSCRFRTSIRSNKTMDICPHVTDLSLLFRTSCSTGGMDAGAPGSPGASRRQPILSRHARTSSGASTHVHRLRTPACSAKRSS
jgi:hypothetical protein